MGTAARFESSPGKPRCWAARCTAWLTTPRMTKSWCRTLWPTRSCVSRRRQREARPIRIIQGPHTHLVTPHAVSLDPSHGEILVASLTGKRINVFAWDANGDAPPLRVIEGPKLAWVTRRRRRGPGFESAGGGEFARHLDFQSHRLGRRRASRAHCRARRPASPTSPGRCSFIEGRIFVAASNHFHQNLYTDVTLKSDAKEIPDDPWLNPTLGFVGVWNISDNGDVPPRATIRGPFGGLLHPVGLALNPKTARSTFPTACETEFSVFWSLNFSSRHSENRPANTALAAVPAASSWAARKRRRYSTVTDLARLRG